MTNPEFVSDGDTTIAVNPASRQCVWRCETFFAKEPDTVEWINSFIEGSTFVDVGANIGLYSLWAAKKRNAKVWAFEPEALNFAELNRNIARNALPIAAFPIALSDVPSIGPLFVAKQEAGWSCHSFGDKVGPGLQPKQFHYRQGSMSARLDDLVGGNLLPQPDYIKIDVDGLEHKVFAGGRNAILNAQSVMIEINSHLAEHVAIVQMMRDAGFSTSDEQIEKARRAEGPFAGTGNVLFVRC